MRAILGSTWQCLIINYHLKRPQNVTGKLSPKCDVDLNCDYGGPLRKLYAISLPSEIATNGHFHFGHEDRVDDVDDPVSGDDVRLQHPGTVAHAIQTSCDQKQNRSSW